MTDLDRPVSRPRFGANGVEDVPREDTKPKALTMPQRSIFTLTNDQLGRMKTLAQMVSNSAFVYGKNLSEADAFLVMVKGIELGLEPMAALDSIDIIQGKPTLSPQGMLALINRTGELDDMTITGNETECTVTMTRTGRSPHTEVFTLAHAKAQQLTGKSNWAKMPEIMLKWRAVSAAARVVFPDIIQGLYMQEELGAEVVYDDAGSVVNEPPALPEPKSDSPTPPAEKPVEKPIASTPDTPPQLIESRLIDFIGFMYPDDNDKFHRKGTIKALREDKVITPQTSYFDATWQILLRRAFKDYLLDESKVIEALATSAGDETIGDIQVWHKRFDDPKAAWEAAWQAVQDYYATNSPPATAKTGKTEEVPF